MKRFMLLTLTAILACSALAGEIYSWKDKEGRTHYSDQPPVGVEAKPARAATAPASAASAAAALADKKRTYKEKAAANAKAEQKTAEEKKQADQKRQYCDSIRSRIATFETGGRLAHSVDGKRVLYTDDERATEIEKARAQFSSSQCEN